MLDMYFINDLVYNRNIQNIIQKLQKITVMNPTKLQKTNLLGSKPKKPTNISFISNQQLIQNMRNKSSRSLHRNRSNETNISFIQKRNQSVKKLEIGDGANDSVRDRDAGRGLQNCNPNFGGVDQGARQSFGKNRQKYQSSANSQSQSSSLLKFLKQNISNKQLLNQVQSLIQVQQSKAHTGTHTPQKQSNQASLLQKIEQLYIQKSALKKEKKALQSRLQEQTKQYEQSLRELRKQNQRLHKVILKQSQMITNQAISEQEGMDGLRRIVLAQAKSLELLGATTKGRLSQGKFPDEKLTGGKFR